MGFKSRQATRARPQTLLQLRISLRDIEPEIWRRVVVPAELELGNLHHVIQVVMEWQNYHLHEFSVGERRFADPHPEEPANTEDEWSVVVSELLPERMARLSYWYDFGDDWWHDVVLEEERERGRREPEFRVLEGARAAPPEDSGGPHGYMHKLDVLRQPAKYDREEAREIVEWIGEDFDSEQLDVEALDKRLQRSFERVQ